MAYNGYNNGGYSNPYESHGNFDIPPSYRPNGDVEMQNMHNGYDSEYTQAPPTRDPNAILNNCREVGKAIDDLEGQLQDLQRVQKGFITGTGATNREIDAKGADIMTGYRSLGERVRRIKSQPDARLPRNEPQVNALDRRIKKAINMFQQTESAFRREVQEQQRRQYLIVRPDATEAEIREATEAGGDTQIFQQALMQSDRRGQAQSALSNVRQRHDAIQQVERTMMELAQLFQDLDTLVVQQEPLIMQVEKSADETNTHMIEANVQLGEATTSARAARRKKFWCLLICILILVVIVVVVLAYLGVNGKL